MSGITAPPAAAPESATDTTQGIIELATEAEVDAGADANKAVTADTLNLSPQTLGAWADIKGTGTVSINDSFNVASITDGGTGTYTVTIDNNAPSNDYATSLTISEEASKAYHYIETKNAGSFIIHLRTDAGGNIDAANVSVMAAFK